MPFYLKKGRNKLTGLAGTKEKGVLQKLRTKLPSKAKARPNTAGAAPLKQPKLQQTAGAKKLTSGPKKFKSAALRMGHGDFMPNFFRRGLLIEFKTASGESGLGTVRDRGPKGVQVLADTGKVLNLFMNEIKGKYRPTAAKAR